MSDVGRVFLLEKPAPQIAVAGEEGKKLRLFTALRWTKSDTFREVVSTRLRAIAMPLLHLCVCAQSPEEVHRRTRSSEVSAERARMSPVTPIRVC